jgi:hypothetical protein
VTRVCGIFSQLLQLFPRTEFEKAVQEPKAERHARGFTCWGQFLAMLFCQLGAQAILQDQDVRRHQRQCRQDPSLDRAHCHAVAPLAATEGTLRLGLGQSAGPVAPAVVRASRFVAVARSALPAPTRAAPRSTRPFPDLNLDSRASHSHVNFGGDADQSSRNLDSLLNFPNRSPNPGTPT